MSRKILLALVLMGCGKLSSAQSTLTYANINPFLGDEFITKVCDTSAVVPGVAGAGITWNFGGLTTTQTDTATAVSCSATPNCTIFSTANGSNLAIVNPNSSLTQYFVSNTSKLSQAGYYNSSTQNAVFSDPMDQFQFPFNYSSHFTDTYAGYITYMGTTIHESGLANVTCDGYGTLVLPGGVTHSNVLRVHTSQTFIDSANLFGTPAMDTFQMDSYTWYKPNYHSALLTIMTANQTGGPVVGAGPIHSKVVSYASQQIRVSVPTMGTVEESLQLFPNPVAGDMHITFNVPSAEKVRVSVYDMMGREVAVIADHYTQGSQNISYSTNSLTRGLYCVRIQSGREAVTRKIEVQ